MKLNIYWNGESPNLFFRFQIDFVIPLCAENFYFFVKKVEKLSDMCSLVFPLCFISPIVLFL